MTACTCCAQPVVQYALRAQQRLDRAIARPCEQRERESRRQARTQAERPERNQRTQPREELGRRGGMFEHLCGEGRRVAELTERRGGAQRMDGRHSYGEPARRVG